MCLNLNGLMGGLIATFLLLAIAFYLTAWCIDVQQKNATTFYTIEDPAGVKMISKDNWKHYKVVPYEEAVGAK